MIYLILALIVAVNLTPFVLPGLDIWHAQGAGVQTCVLLIFSWMFFCSPKYREIPNRPLAFLHLWVGLVTAFICISSQFNSRYEILRFFPYFNFLCILIIYKAIVQYLSLKDLDRVFIFLKYSVIITLFMCVLQACGISQFYKLFRPDNYFYNNIVTGFIGNGTHLSGFLGMTVPLFLYKFNRENLLCLILMAVVLCFFTGTGVGEISTSGIVVAGVCGIYYIAHHKNTWKWILSGIALVLVVFIFLPNNIKEILVNPSGRIGLWSYYFNLSRPNFISGVGFGAVDLIYTKTPFKDSRHVHLEYLQFLFEGGLVVIVCIIYLIKDFLRRRTTDIGLAFKSVFVGFLVSCCFNYPAHLWLASTYACIAYASLIAFNERLENGNCD